MKPSAKYRDAEQLEAIHGKRGRIGLQQRNEKRTERHQKKKKQQRRHQRTKNLPAKHRQQQDLKHQNDAQLGRLVNIEQGGGEPKRGCRRQQRQCPP